MKRSVLIATLLSAGLSLAAFVLSGTALARGNGTIRVPNASHATVKAPKVFHTTIRVPKSSHAPIKVRKIRKSPGRRP